MLASTINATHHDFNLWRQFKQLLVKRILVALYFRPATYPVQVQERHDNVKNIAPQSQLYIASIRCYINKADALPVSLGRF